MTQITDRFKDATSYEIDNADIAKDRAAGSGLTTNNGHVR